MALPAGIATVTLRCGPYVDFTGDPVAGSIRIVASTPLIWLADSTAILNRIEKITLDQNGYAEVLLPATDQDGFNVDHWTYRIEYTFQTFSHPFYISLPESDPIVDLESIPHYTTCSPSGGGPIVPPDCDCELALSDLTDVDLDGAQPGQTLVLSADNQWVPGNSEGHPQGAVAGSSQRNWGFFEDVSLLPPAGSGQVTGDYALVKVVQ
ncbi:MAG TPA: hypothetical protein VHK27_15075 [Gammaproteobacteria bacterium]|nr:hypothetical protein [Gammaproteobacteria bacterium]